MNEKIMNFESLDEEIEFWDTHDATDFMGEEVTVEEIIREHQRNHQQTQVTIQLDVELLNQIKKLAIKMDINDSLLMRDLLLEGLKSYLRR